MTNEFIIIPSPSKKGMQAAESLSKALNSVVMSNAFSNCDRDYFNTFFDSLKNAKCSTVNREESDETREHMPSDAFVDLVMKPIYRTGAMVINAVVKYPELLQDDDTKKIMAEVLGCCTLRNFLDHGYDAQTGKLDNLLLFAKAGAKEFVEMHIPEFEGFNTAYLVEIKNIRGEIDDYKASKNNSTPREIFVFSFGRSVVTSKMLQILAAHEGFNNTIFVYGTLMKGERANRLVTNGRYGGDFFLSGFSAYDNGSYPQITQDHKGFVYGEVWFVNDEMVEALDCYENEGVLYNRQSVIVKSIHSDLIAEAYVYNGTPEGERVEGRWNNLSNEVWYATYGSNMLEERLKVYLAGGEYQGRIYFGCNKCQNFNLWTESYWATFDGERYFAESSSRWDGGGVAFYDPDAKGKVEMRLYKITSEQLDDIQAQECGYNPVTCGNKVTGWYDHKVFLGYGYDGRPIYTLTSNRRRRENKPSVRYIEVINQGLNKDK